ncbi:plasmid replication initiator TrfA [Luteimonas sp. MHLX1A]|uniref:plasmid replication initiator TrfA n=1 Tax=Alterluteimonas muca TaxID=2878684 RepID=UPI001E43665C|nr:plasmid replication initiator TrfA [Luteimonas sp. MHLX1A]MCD9046744.1 hypothetical protein [Luteimonas sp. MHLX1A]
MDEQTFKARIREHLAEDSFQQWIAPLRVSVSGSREITLWAPNVFVQDEVKTSCWHAVTKVCSDYPAIRVKVGSPSEAKPAKAPSTPKVDGVPKRLTALWPDPERALPADFARVALFTANAWRGKARPQLSDAVIYSQANMQVRQTGPALNHLDEDVFLAALHLLRNYPIGDEVQLSMAELATTMGLSPAGKNIQSIQERLQRLHKTQLELVVNFQGGVSRTYSGYLIPSYYREEAKGSGHQQWVIQFDPKLCSLLTPNLLTRIIWDTRHTLRSAVSKRLHVFYASHAKPYPMKVETLVQICGLEVGPSQADKAKAAHAVRTALDELMQAGFLASWTLNAAGLVSVVKTDAPALA